MLALGNKLTIVDVFFVKGLTRTWINTEIQICTEVLAYSTGAELSSALALEVAVYQSRAGRV